MSYTVPPHYQGLWRRTLLTAPGLRDDTTLVLWMQTAQWHADLRIPADRPPCEGRRSVHDCSHDELLGLLRQEGFAGITQVQGDTCEWLRQLDYRPSGRRDLGCMAFASTLDAIDEYGVEADYAERWEREPASDQTGWVARSRSAEGPVLWLRSGRRFMLIRPRAMDATQSRELWACLAAGRATVEELRRLADFEITYGVIAEDDGRILHSTLPWREWQTIALPEAWAFD